MTGFSRVLTVGLLVVAAVLGGLLLFRQGQSPALGGEALDTPLPLPALALVDDRAQPTTLAATDGRLRLVFYGFVRCPDVCPATLASLKNTLATLPDDQRGRVQVQFITVDPAHDTAPVVRAYLERFDPAFTGLTGEAATIDEAARVMFVANVKPPLASADHGTDHSAHMGGAAQAGDGAANAQAAGASAAVAARMHGDQVSVVDGQGRFVRVYGNEAVVNGKLDRDLPRLIREYAN
ncbi:SCO family protein [Deinococcus indicus]|uniref:SCO family protein n=1 Tax=Deinococcus indicus TaxID=223556 RepID=A0A246BH51_9DEIO|nr:SCO family protein [Deinococcus indicus]OWL94546.1 SCO family protein [Deinococcus indicus]